MMGLPYRRAPMAEIPMAMDQEEVRAMRYFLLKLTGFEGALATLSMLWCRTILSLLKHNIATLSTLATIPR